MLAWHGKYKQKIRDLAEKYGDKSAFVNMREQALTTNTSFKEVLKGCAEVEQLLLSVGVGQMKYMYERVNR